MITQDKTHFKTKAKLKGEEMVELCMGFKCHVLLCGNNNNITWHDSHAFPKGGIKTKQKKLELDPSKPT